MSRHTQRTLTRKAQVAWVTGTLALGGVAVAGGAQALSAQEHGAPSAERVKNVAATGNNGGKASGEQENGEGGSRQPMCARLDAGTVKAIAAAAAAKGPQSNKQLVRLANGEVVVPLQSVHLYRCPTGAKPPVGLPPVAVPPPVTGPPVTSTASQPPVSQPPVTSTSTLPPVTSTLPPVTQPPVTSTSTKPPVTPSTSTPPVVSSTGS